MKILSYNIACLPNIFNFFGKPCDRINNLNKFISKQNPDIFCLQEVFSSSTIKSIYDYFSSNYYIYSTNNTYIRLDSGLLIGSKYPIVNKSNYTFKHYYGEDRLSYKGILNVDIKVNNKIYSIFNTHLNADPIFGNKDKAFSIRKKQLNELLTLINDKKKNKIYNIILAGDFNIDYRNKEIINPLLMTYKHHIINKKRIITFSEDKTQIDYIIVLYNKKHKYKPKYKRFINTKLSDHYMIQLEI